MSSRLTIATIISAFFAPLVWNWLGNFGPQTLTTNVLAWIAGCLTLITLLTGVWAYRMQKGPTSHVEFENAHGGPHLPDDPTIEIQQNNY